MQQDIDRSVAHTQSRPWHISPWIVIGLFGLLLFTPAAVQLFFAGGSGQSENRVLAPFPTVGSIKSLSLFSRRLENYINDHFGLRDQLVRTNNLMRFRAGLSSNPKVVVGRDGWLFYAAERILEQHVGLDVFTPAELEAWIARMEADQAWLAKRGIPMIIMLAPDKNTIYPEYLPQFPKRADTTTRADQIVARAKTSKLTFIDPRPEIIAAKANHPRLYFEGDSHWLHRAAFIAYEKLVPEIARHFPALRPLVLDDFEIANAPLTSDQAHLLNLHKDLIFTGEVFSRKPPAARQGADVRKSTPGGTWGWPITFHRTPVATSPRAVIFGDSFTDYILGPAFLYETLRDPVYTHHSLGMFNFALVDEVKPDIVIVVMAERYLKTIPGVPLGY